MNKQVRMIRGVVSMERAGQELAAFLPTDATLKLVGDVGAGKTTLTRGIARGLGITEDIQSPTFTISRRYQNPEGQQLVHYDFYRLNDPGLMADELYEAVTDLQTITVVEWAEDVAGVLPTDHIAISITPRGEHERVLEVQSEVDLSTWFTEGAE